MVLTVQMVPMVWVDLMGPVKLDWRVLAMVEVEAKGVFLLWPQMFEIEMKI